MPEQITSINEWAKAYIRLKTEIGTQVEMLEVMKEALILSARRMKEIEQDVTTTVEIIKEAVGMYDK